MPNRTLDQSAKPFEVKVGLGFGSFGGMYRLGDPSMCPAHRFRRLVNVRLGGKDIGSRPGLDAKWDSTTGEPVVGMIEQQKSKSGKLWFGPLVGPTFGSYVDPVDPTLTTYLYCALILDEQFPISADPALSGKYILGYLPEKVENPNTLTDDLLVQSPVEWRKLAPISHFPYAHKDAPVYPPTGLSIINSGGRPYAASNPVGTIGVETFTHEHIGEIVVSNLGVDYCGIFPDEQQWGCCLDPPILFRGKWIAPGSIIPVLHNPAVMAGTPAPDLNDVNTGQQLFEVVFDAGLADPPQGLLDSIAMEPTVYGREGLDNFFAGSLTELCRMPGKSYPRIPTRALGGMDGKTIRSMCVRSTRNDDPITAEEATSEKLYLGTFGGYPIAMGYWKTAGTEFVWPIHNIADGAVYSFDGVTVRPETAGLGPAVVVCTLPDGSILACGRTAAKLLDAQDDTWKAVAYSPAYSALPRYATGAVPPDLSDPDWRAKGFIWTDRTIFNGEAYFIGFDTARMALNALYSFPLLPPAGGTYQATHDSLVVYRFNRATMQMVRVRGGEEIYAALRPTRFPILPLDPFVASLVPWFAPALAVWGGKLYYSWALGLPMPADSDDPGGDTYGVGAYDGLAFEDDAVYFKSYYPGAIAEIPTDLLATSRGLFMTRVEGSRAISLWLWNGSLAPIIFSDLNAVATVALALANGGRMFIGPS